MTANPVRPHIQRSGEVYSAPETGAARALSELAYSLYLLEHNVELRSRLIGRLKDHDQFAGVLTEIRVAGMLIRAGFDVKFEDEDDSTSDLERRAARRSGFLPCYQIASELVSGGVSNHYPMDYCRAYLCG